MMSLNCVYICIQWGVRFWGFEVIWRGVGFRLRLAFNGESVFGPTGLFFFQIHVFFQKLFKKFEIFSKNSCDTG